jgi:hypothetical protein
MRLFYGLKQKSTKSTKKAKAMKKYADGGNVASGTPNYGFNQMNPMPGQTMGTNMPNQNPAMGTNPPAFNAMGPMASRPTPFKKGGKVKAKAKSAPAKSSASRRGDGIAIKGKTKGKMR